MNQGLNDLTRHNAWATKYLLDYCRTLTADDLNATVPGTYGTIHNTLIHLIGAETSYLSRLTTGKRASIWEDDEPVDLDALAAQAEKLAAEWEAFIAAGVDFEKPGEAYGDNGDLFAVPAGVFITQALHHANEHRAHICTIIGSLGYQAPEVSGWEYAFATGRSKLTAKGTR